MTSKPLQYQSLKIVLEHMDPNLRFQLSRQIPSIRNVEKVVPLKIDQLSFNLGQMVINDTEYKLGIYRNHHSDDVPERIKKANDAGGLNYDIDQWGFRDFSDLNHVTPGDVIVEDRDIMNKVLTERDEQVENISNLGMFITAEEERIKGHQDFLDCVINEMKHGNNMKSYECYYKGLIATSQAVLAPYHRMRDNKLPEYDTWIQLETKSKGRCQIEWIKYNKKLYEANKYLLKLFFSGRRSSVVVNRFKIGVSHSVLRLPIGLKFKIKDLKVLNENPLESSTFLSIIDESSLPIRNLTIANFNGKIDIHIFKTTDKLTIDFVHGRGIGFQWLLILPNKIAVFNNCWFAPDVFLRLVRNWLETCREVGTDYSFVGVGEPVVERLMERIREEFNDAIVGKRHVIIHMKNSSHHLRITHSPFNPSTGPLLKMEVL